MGGDKGADDRADDSARWRKDFFPIRAGANKGTLRAVTINRRTNSEASSGSDGGPDEYIPPAMPGAAARGYQLHGGARKSLVASTGSDDHGIVCNRLKIAFH